MRTYGRTTNPDTLEQTWVVVETQPSGLNDDVYVTALCQVLKLNLNESPFYATWGIPARNSVVQQIPPTVYAQLTQQRMAPNFANLQVTYAGEQPDSTGRPAPTYQVSVTTHVGTTPFSTAPGQVPQ